MAKSDQRRGFSVGVLPPCVNQLPKPAGVVVAMAHRRVMLTVAGVDAPGHPPVDRGTRSMHLVSRPEPRTLAIEGDAPTRTDDPRARSSRPGLSSFARVTFPRPKRTSSACAFLAPLPDNPSLSGACIPHVPFLIRAISARVCLTEGRSKCDVRTKCPLIATTVAVVRTRMIVISNTKRG
jgi:hypothetical protein